MIIAFVVDKTTDHPSDEDLSLGTPTAAGAPGAPAFIPHPNVLPDRAVICAPPGLREHFLRLTQDCALG